MRRGNEGNEGAQQATSFTSISNGGSAPNCFFCRLGKLHGDEVLFGIKIVLADFIDHTNLVELRCRLIRDRLVKFSQLERRGISLVPHTDNKF